MFADSGSLAARPPDGSTLGCVAQATDGRCGTQADCQTLSRLDWNALGRVGCRVLDAELSDLAEHACSGSQQTELEDMRERQRPPELQADALVEAIEQ
jgi:hypothetical protein